MVLILVFVSLLSIKFHIKLSISNLIFILLIKNIQMLLSMKINIKLK